MPKALSTPQILKAISKEEVESVPTLKPRILTTKDYTNIIDNSKKKHIERVRDAWHKRLERNKRELPELTEDTYRRIYGDRLGSSSNEHAAAEHPVENENVTIPKHARVTSFQENLSNKSHSEIPVGKENIPSLQEVINTLPETPVPRKQVPKRIIESNVDVVPIMKVASQKNDKSNSESNKIEDRASKPRNQAKKTVISFGFDPHTKKNQQLSSSTTNPRNKLNAINPESNLNIQPLHQETMPLDQMSDDGLDTEYLRVMQSLEFEDVSTGKDKNRAPLTMKHSVEVYELNRDNRDTSSEKSDTPSITRMYSHIDNMTKYLETLSDPEGLSAYDNQSEHQQKNQTADVNFSTPSKKTTLANITSPDAHPRTSIPLSTTIPSQVPHTAQHATQYISQHSQYHAIASSPEEHDAKEEILSTPSIPSPEEISMKRHPKLQEKYMTRHVRPYVLQHDEKVQVPTPSRHGDYIDSVVNFGMESEDIDPQTLLECEAPHTLEELNFNLDMPSFSTIGKAPSQMDTVLPGVDMSAMSLVDVRNHIFSVCDALNSNLYVPLEEKKAEVPPEFFDKPTAYPVKHIRREIVHTFLPKRRVKIEHFSMWKTNRNQCSHLRQRRIKEIWTIQQRLIDEFFEKNSSLFQKVENIREQIRKEQAMVVRVQLRTTKSQELRQKKIREGMEKPSSTIRATIRSSQSSYNLSMWEDQASRLIAKIFLRFLKFLTVLKREREVALLLVEKEESEITLQNVMIMWKSYVSLYRGESQRIHEVRSQHKIYVLKDAFRLWREALHQRYTMYEQNAAADRMAHQSLMKRAFRSILYGRAKNELQHMEDNIATRWCQVNQIANLFSLWRQVAQRGHILKQKLMNYAYSKVNENSIIDENLQIEHLQLLSRVRQSFYGDFMPHYSRLKTTYATLSKLSRLSFSQVNDDSKNLAFQDSSKPQSSTFLNPYNTPEHDHLTKVSTMHSISHKTSHERIHAPESQLVRNTSIFIGTESLAEIADRSYNIKLMRGMLYHWRFILYRLDIAKQADDYRNVQLKKIAMRNWAKITSNLHQAEQQIVNMRNNRIVKQYFSKWKTDTQTFVELKDNIAIQCNEYHITQRIFKRWNQYTIKRQRMREKEILFSKKMDLIMLSRAIQHWRLRLNSKAIKMEMKIIADKHYQYILIEAALKQWQSKTKNRQLLKRVFNRALQAYRLESETPTGSLRESIMRRTFTLWKKRAKTSSRIKTLKLQWEVAKHWHKKKLYIKAFTTWKFLHEKQLQADALYYNFLLQRAQRSFENWRIYTSMKKQQRAAKTREKELINQIHLGLLLRSTFRQWKNVTSRNRIQKIQTMNPIPAGPLKLSFNDDFSDKNSRNSPISCASSINSFTEKRSSSNSEKNFEEYRRVHEEMKEYKRNRLAAMKEEFHRQVSVAQIYYLKKLKLKMWKAWKSVVDENRSKQIIIERVDHFYNSKLQKMRFGRTAVSIERLENNIDHLPSYFQPTYRIVNYRLLLKALQDWKQYTREKKTQKIGLAIAARFHRRKLLEKTIANWKSALHLLSKSNYSTTTANKSEAGNYKRYNDEHSDSYYIGNQMQMYRPAKVSANVVSTEGSLDRYQYGKPRKPFEIITIPTGRVYVSP